MEYLYNVIYHGGRSVGKSPTMPYWGLTIGQQGVADVIAYLKATFKGVPQMAEVAPSVGGGPLGVCPQPRKTKRAPGTFRSLNNPLPASKANIKAGEKLFQDADNPNKTITMALDEDTNPFLEINQVGAPRFLLREMMVDPKGTSEIGMFIFNQEGEGQWYAPQFGQTAAHRHPPWRKPKYPTQLEWLTFWYQLHVGNSDFNQDGITVGFSESFDTGNILCYINYLPSTRAEVVQPTEKTHFGNVRA